MYTTIGENGEVDIKESGIKPGNYRLTLGFGPYLHLYSETAWKALEKAFQIGLTPGIPVIIQKESADLAERIYSLAEEISTGGAALMIPRILAREVGLQYQLRITRIPAGGYWRLTPLNGETAARLSAQLG